MTTASSIIVDSSVRTTVMGLNDTGTSTVDMPMNDTSSFWPSAACSSNEPSTPVVVPVTVPSTITLAPMTG